MAIIVIASPSEQVADHLRGELRRGRWKSVLPGVPALAAELGIDHKTVASAMGLLEHEGVLIGQGTGRPRRITLSKDQISKALRIGILFYQSQDRQSDYLVDVRHRLESRGYHPFVLRKSLTELGMKIPRIRREVEKAEAEAWVLCGGSREVVAWFAEQRVPAFALFGRRRELPIAGVGPDHVEAGRALARRLLSLGHRRIVIIARESQRASGPGRAERAIFEEMESHGLSTGPYNLPEWKDNPKDLHRLLDDLFQVTPPTALIIDEPLVFHSVKDHLAQRGVLAPKHVSLICTDPDPTFAWCRPSIAHFSWDSRPVVRRVVGWVDNVARGKEDRRQTLTHIEFIEGGTVGPAPR